MGLRLTNNPHYTILYYDYEYFAHAFQGVFALL